MVNIHMLLIDLIDFIKSFIFQAQYLLWVENFWGRRNLGNFVTLWFAYKTPNSRTIFLFSHTILTLHKKKFCKKSEDAWWVIINILLKTDELLSTGGVDLSKCEQGRANFCQIGWWWKSESAETQISMRIQICKEKNHNFRSASKYN